MIYERTRIHHRIDGSEPCAHFVKQFLKMAKKKKKKKRIEKKSWACATYVEDVMRIKYRNMLLR